MFVRQRRQGRGRLLHGDIEANRVRIDEFIPIADIEQKRVCVLGRFGASQTAHGATIPTPLQGQRHHIPQARFIFGYVRPLPNPLEKGVPGLFLCSFSRASSLFFSHGLCRLHMDRLRR